MLKFDRQHALNSPATKPNLPSFSLIRTRVFIIPSRLRPVTRAETIFGVKIINSSLHGCTHYDEEKRNVLRDRVRFRQLNPTQAFEEWFLLNRLGHVQKWTSLNETSGLSHTFLLIKEVTIVLPTNLALLFLSCSYSFRLQNLAVLQVHIHINCFAITIGFWFI